MIASWLRSFFRLADLPTSSLRVLLLALPRGSVGRRLRAPIEQELLVREWAERVEQHLASTWSCVWCSRGGVS